MRPPTILKYLILFNVFLLSLSECPQYCQCDHNSVRCMHEDLQVIPKTPQEAHTLDVRFNRIYDIAPGCFSHLHQLRSLLLNDNKLTALRSGAFHGLRRVKYLYLYRNRINHIDSDVFQGMIHLEQLYLHVNEIHLIEPQTFSNLPRLERLYLHNNNLKTIPPGSFRGLPKLQKLRLDSNGLICDCSMLWFVEMLAEHNDMTIAATCYGPSGVTGTSLAAMKESDFNCKRPVFKKEPEDVVVNFGEDAMFICSAIGEPKPEIVWFRDSAILPLESSRYELMDNGTLMVHEADENDIGIFECMAKNPAGEVLSKPAKMLLHTNVITKDHPVFTISPQNQMATRYQNFATFDCVATGDPKPHISWSFNGEKILISDRISLKHNGSIVIEKVENSDAGTYSCEAENIHGKISSSVSLQVLVSPVFTSVPNNEEVSIGDRAQFTCTAMGVPKPVITWYKNTMTLPPKDNIVLTDDNQNLTITDVTEDDAGIYHCRAENSEGLTEISAELKVEDEIDLAPKITLRPEDVEAFKETTVQLPCEYESEPLVTVEWRINGNRIVRDDRKIISLIGGLIINNLTLTDSGSYECSVYNSYGRDTASAILTVKDHILPGDEYVNIALTEATRDIDQAIARTIEQMFTNRSGTGIHDLYRIARFPNAPAREVARAAEIYDRALDKIRDYIQNNLKITTVEPFHYENILSPKHLDVISRLSGCVAHRTHDDCFDMCFHKKYRTIDGTCNNLDNPTWGASLTPFRRILYPIYENGFSEPVGWNRELKYNGYSLPSARLISTSVISTKNITKDDYFTHMLMQWGQWLDHDIDHALPSVSDQTWDGIDCKKTCDYAAPCFPIDVPINDTRIKNRRCIDFVRTSSVCGSGMTSVLFGKLEAREQINQLTSFIDASQVYGFEKTVAEDLRDITNNNGTLRVGPKFLGKKPLLPTTGINAMDCRLNLEESTQPCFVAGDIRANEQIGLVAMHTIFMREHNRLANQLKAINPFWDGDKIYQETRKIVGAEIQQITYYNWLPLILGPKGYASLENYKEYDSRKNPSISNVFATAALRFGHSLINPILHRYDEHFETIPQGHLRLHNAFFAPWRLVNEGGVDPLIRGMFMTPGKMKTPTQNLNSELTEKLFHTAHAVALDLAAINIQRSRDHAIPGYTKWRSICNMTEVNDFDDLASEISDKSVRDKLKELYGSVHNIDVWVGGILEDTPNGAKIGPLFQCLLIEQFKRLRDGDRLWFERPTTFKQEQLREIKKVSLARILCDNGDNIDTIGENVFILPDMQDGLISCEDLPSIDLRYWMDCDTCNNDYEEENKRVRRDVLSDPEHMKPSSVIENEHRLEILEDSHTELFKFIETLQKKVELLEETCQKH